MYANYSPRTPIILRSAFTCLSLTLTALLSLLGDQAHAQSQVIRNITSDTERLELTVNSSRILTLEKRIPRMVVNNPDLVTVTALSANQIQLAARKPGVTQVNLWDEDGKVYSVDVMIYGDVKELEHALKRLFPESSVNVIRLTNSLVLEGFVERPEAVGPIVRLSEDYAPKVVNNITVGGVQQVLLKVKVMEVSRTKLRRLGFDFTQVSGSGGFVSSSISDLISSVESGVGGVVTTAAGDTVRFGVVDGNDTFFGFLDALQENKVAKILADPTITAISGRPAKFNVGGEFPIVIPSGLGQSTVQFKPFGTQVDFLPLVLGNGNIRLEVRPRVSERDDANGIVQNGFEVPALKVREVDTGVEMKAGQTLALAGLVQTRVEGQERGLPFLGDLPYVGAAFRSVAEEVNEVELLILVTPEFADGMEPHEVPPCGPGMESVSPTNCQLYCGGHLEVPACGPCGPNGCGVGSCGGNCGPGGGTVISDGSYPANGVENYDGSMQMDSAPHSLPTPAEPVGPDAQLQLNGVPQPAYESLPDPSASRQSPWSPAQVPAQFSRDSSSYSRTQQQSVSKTATPGLIGPIGYDVGE